MEFNIYFKRYPILTPLDIFVCRALLEKNILWQAKALEYSWLN